MSAHSVELSLLQAWPVERWRGRRVLVAVSGGPDSVAALWAILRTAPNPDLICVAHFNHRWRGQASDDDAQFVRELCQRTSVNLVDKAAEQTDVVTKSEEAARLCRYQFLIDAAYQTGSQFVVTGHTADDRIETALHNLLRGSGLAGIAGPRAMRLLSEGIMLVRPLLSVFRCQVLDYLSALDQGYRLDATNWDDRFSRNFIRTKLLPLARQHYVNGVDRQILSLAEIARESIDALSVIAARWLDQQPISSPALDEIVRRFELENPWYVMHSSLVAMPAPVIREALKQVWQVRGWPMKSMNRKHWLSVYSVLVASDSVQCPQQRLTLPGNLHVMVCGQLRVIGRRRKC